MNIIKYYAGYLVRYLPGAAALKKVIGWGPGRG